MNQCLFVLGMPERGVGTRKSVDRHGGLLSIVEMSEIFSRHEPCGNDGYRVDDSSLVSAHIVM